MIDNMDSFRRIVCRNQDVRKIRLVCDAHGIFLAFIFYILHIKIILKYCESQEKKESRSLRSMEHNLPYVFVLCDDL